MRFVTDTPAESVMEAGFLRRRDFCGLMTTGAASDATIQSAGMSGIRAAPVVDKAQQNRVGRRNQLHQIRRRVREIAFVRASEPFRSRFSSHAGGRCAAHHPAELELK